MSDFRPAIEFVPVGEADLPLLRSWMIQPHWREWWGDPDTELAYVRDMIEGRDTTEPYLFHVDGRPLGYIQAWFIADQRHDEALVADHPWLAELPDDAVGVDLSIGDGDRLGQGSGSAVLGSFVDRLWNRGYRTIIIDPDPDNARAVRAYGRAGFRPIPALLGRSGDSLIMQYHPDRTERGERAA